MPHTKGVEGALRALIAAIDQAVRARVSEAGQRCAREARPAAHEALQSARAALRPGALEALEAAVRSRDIDQLEAALKKSKREYEKALGRALRAEMK